MNDQPPATHRGKILVIDDNPTNLHILAKLLRESHYDVRAVTSGAMALTVIPIMLPDLILLDIRMPQMDGYEVCQQLKINPQTQAIPIIFLSALSDVADKVKAFEVGGVDYISKPFRIAEVLARVETHLSLQRLQQHLQVQHDRLLQEVKAREQAEAIYEQLVQQTGRLAVLPVELSNCATRLADVTVLAADVVASALAEVVSPVALVRQIQELFTEFDRLVAQQGLTKLKAGGASYRVAAGLPARPAPAEGATAPANPVVAIADLALGMQQRAAQVEPPLSLQIGIHTASVIVPLRSDAPADYDLWGEAVEVANWLQCQTRPGSIQITAVVRDRLPAPYRLESAAGAAMATEIVSPCWLSYGLKEKQAD